MERITEIFTHTSTMLAREWEKKALAQGAVCLVCHEPPKLERRPEFYDSGLCAACAREIASTSRSVAGPAQSDKA
jgi:hypothetical protein